MLTSHLFILLEYAINLLYKGMKKDAIKDVVLSDSLVFELRKKKLKRKHKK